MDLNHVELHSSLLQAPHEDEHNAMFRVTCAVSTPAAPNIPSPVPSGKLLLKKGSFSKSNPNTVEQKENIKHISSCCTTATICQSKHLAECTKKVSGLIYPFVDFVKYLEHKEYSAQGSRFWKTKHTWSCSISASEAEQ